MELTIEQRISLHLIQSCAPADVTEALANSGLDTAKHGETRSPDLVTVGWSPRSEDAD